MESIKNKQKIIRFMQKHKKTNVKQYFYQKYKKTFKKTPKTKKNQSFKGNLQNRAGFQRFRLKLWFFCFFLFFEGFLILLVKVWFYIGFLMFLHKSNDILYVFNAFHAKLLVFLWFSLFFYTKYALNIVNTSIITPCMLKSL